MNWKEFVKECEETMRKKGVSPKDVTVRVEVGDSFYDDNVKSGNIGVTYYTDPGDPTLRPYLVIWGRE